jgi:hypothetical protein
MFGFSYHFFQNERDFISSINHLFYVVVFIMRIQMRFTKHDLPLLLVGTGVTNPHPHRFAPCLLTRLTILVAGFIFCQDARIFDIWSRITNHFQFNPVFDPIAKVIHLFQHFSRQHIEIGDADLGRSTSFKRIDCAKVHLPETAALPAPDEFPEPAQVVKVIVGKSVTQNSIKISQVLLALNLDPAPEAFAVPEIRFKLEDLPGLHTRERLLLNP